MANAWADSETDKFGQVRSMISNVDYHKSYVRSILQVFELLDHLIAGGIRQVRQASWVKLRHLSDH